ncbi:MAG: class I tRNA ligase family protein, partial [Candidatus Pacebacteria bacterium]|nr:class I tRNA ligase family protein [Candidatus Paceibacterota bacterium]
QWMLAITKYADRLISDLETVDYSEKIKTQQINWIGKSEGALMKFRIANNDEKIEVFTTRPDTLFGCTYLVVAPEHELVQNKNIENREEVNEYVKEAKNKSDLERGELNKEKTGVELKGVKAINPINGEEVPIFVADYVLSGYGTGAIMAVPAHDERDYEFAQKFNLKIVEVISGGDVEKESYAGEGKLKNSGEFNGMNSEEAKWKITEKAGGERTTQYKLRDWVFSRQHYWGEPIPLVFCEKCGWVAVPEEKLPVELPEVESYEPTDTGESPLALMEDWVKTTCPKCGGEAKRETDTMPNWAGSSWYFLRYIDPKNSEVLADKEKLKYWMPVDLYNGGMEHTTLHLLYSRFWNKFLYDIGVVSFSEPYKKRRSHGIVLAEDGRKMSKSFGNVINPDEIVKRFGADSLRLYEMFMGPFSEMIPWNTDGLVGVKKFLEKVWGIQKKVENGVFFEQSNGEERKITHKTVKKVGEDIEVMKFNTAVAQMMIWANETTKEKEIKKNDFEMFLKVLAPFAPHIAEEIWKRLGNKESIFKEGWPAYDKEIIKDEKIILVIQINGKVRDEIETEIGIEEEEIKKKALSLEKIKKIIEGKEIKKIVFVKGKLINIVI